MDISVRLIFTVFLFVTSGVLLCQDCQLNFRSPVNHETRLSGSFGEPRSRHFHAGIDYKQKNGVPRDTIYAVEDGFISRIDVQADGYGNALLLKHRCNKSSLYAHLYDFNPRIRSYIDSVLTVQKRYTIYHTITDSVLYFRKGDYIGILGNSGRSSGPHLHFEIRDSRSERALHPGHFGFKPKDNIPPFIRGIMLYELNPEGQELGKQFLLAQQISKNRYRLADEVIDVPYLKLGLGIRTYDTMNGASNHNGIYGLNMKVDGKLAYSFSLDSISFDLSKYLHAHMDYEAKVNRQYVTKCFKNPGNLLDIYDQYEDDGVIYTYGFKTTRVEIEVYDMEGNLSSIEFQVRRNDEFPSRSLNARIKENYISLSDSTQINLGHTTLEFYPYTFSEPLTLEFDSTTSDHAIPLEQDRKIPLFNNFKILHSLQKVDFPKEKYIFSSMNNKGEYVRYKAKWENDSTVVTFSNQLSTYHIDVDTTPPKIQIVNLPSKNKQPIFKVKVTDNYIPVYDMDQIQVEVYVNGKWQLCRQDAKTNTTWFRVDPDKFSSDLKIKVVARDGSNNATHIERVISAAKLN